MQNVDHNIGFWEKRQFFHRKLSKMVENCDHNIDPRTWGSSQTIPFYKISLLEWSEKVFPAFKKTLMHNTVVDTVHFDTF
jgi:hypothetical protein